MARELGDLIVRLSLDSAKFEDGLKRLESQITRVQSQFRSSATGLTDFDKVTSKLQTSANTLTERLGLQKDKVEGDTSSASERGNNPPRGGRSGLPV